MKKENKVIIYRDGVVARRHNSRIAVHPVHFEETKENKVFISFKICDGFEKKRATHKVKKRAGKVVVQTTFNLSQEGAMLLTEALIRALNLDPSKELVIPTIVKKQK